MRKPAWSGRRRQSATAPERAESNPLKYETIPAGARIGDRFISYMHAQQSIWCQEADGTHIGVTSWGEGRTPSLQIAASHDLADRTEGSEAELIVRCAMAAWRRLFKNQPLDPALPVREHPGLERLAAPPREENAVAGR